MRVQIHMQQRSPVLAMDCLLADVLRWSPKTVPEGYVLMLIKSCLNLAHCT